jgi:hypothetical protein
LWVIEAISGSGNAHLAAHAVEARIWLLQIKKYGIQPHGGGASNIARLVIHKDNG